VVNQLSQSTLLLALTSTFVSLPLFLFTLPAGALADMVDRAKLVRITHVWLAAAAGGLAILGWSHLLQGKLVLLFVFLIGTGFAFNAPAYSSLLTDFVSDEELESASVLNGLQLNIADIIGPVLAGGVTGTLLLSKEQLQVSGLPSHRKTATGRAKAQERSIPFSFHTLPSNGFSTTSSGRLDVQNPPGLGKRSHTLMSRFVERRFLGRRGTEASG
jgi:Transmembrane secretion effector